jgi:hypothetical protein
MKVVVGGREIYLSSFLFEGYEGLPEFLREVNFRSYGKKADEEIIRPFDEAHVALFAHDKDNCLVGCACVTRPSQSEREHCPREIQWMVRSFAVHPSAKGLGKHLWLALFDELVRTSPPPKTVEEAHRGLYLYTCERSDFWGEKIGFTTYKECEEYSWLWLAVCILPECPLP